MRLVQMQSIYSSAQKTKAAYCFCVLNSVSSCAEAISKEAADHEAGANAEHSFPCVLRALVSRNCSGSNFSEIQMYCCICTTKVRNTWKWQQWFLVGEVSS